MKTRIKRESVLGEGEMDLTPLIMDINLDMTEFVQDFIQRFSQDVKNMIASVLG